MRHHSTIRLRKDLLDSQLQSSEDSFSSTTSEIRYKPKGMEQVNSYFQNVLQNVEKMVQTPATNIQSEHLKEVQIVRALLNNMESNPEILKEFETKIRQQIEHCSVEHAFAKHHICKRIFEDTPEFLTYDVQNQTYTFLILKSKDEKERDVLCVPSDFHNILTVHDMEFLKTKNIGHIYSFEKQTYETLDQYLARVAPQAPKPVVPPVPAKPAPVMRPKQGDASNGKSAKWLWILLGLIVLALIIFAIVRASKKKPSSE